MGGGFGDGVGNELDCGLVRVETVAAKASPASIAIVRVELKYILRCEGE